MANESGWQIGITRADANPDNHAEEPTEAEERAAMEHAGIEPEEMIAPGTWIAAIPAEWARAAQAEDADEKCEAGQQIQECQPHEITGPDGRKWTIEIPMP